MRKTLSDKLRIKANMICIGERIQRGSEPQLMIEAADRIENLEFTLERAKIYYWNSSLDLAIKEIDKIEEACNSFLENYPTTLDYRETFRDKSFIFKTLRQVIESKKYYE